MTDFVTDDGEVIDYAKAATQAKSRIATFKFGLLETVRGDPRLSKAPCESVVGVLASFLTVDDRTLKPTRVYASNTTILSRTNIKTRQSIKKARDLLQQYEYCVTQGRTASGCDLYELRNPHAEFVKMHSLAKAEKLKEEAAAAREEERRKNELKRHRGSTDNPAENSEGVIKSPRRGSTDNPAENSEGVIKSPRRGSTDNPNFVEYYRGRKGIEKENILSAYGEEDNQQQPLPVPASQAELEHMMTEICSGVSISPAIISQLRRLLLAGELTLEIINLQRDHAERNAA